MLAILQQQAEPDFACFSTADEAALQQFPVGLTAIVDAGPTPRRRRGRHRACRLGTVSALCTQHRLPN